MKLQTKIERLAANDAYDWAMLDLLNADIGWKYNNITGYGEAFHKAFGTVNLEAENKFLQKERDRLVKKGFTQMPALKPKHRKLKVVLLVGVGLVVANELGYLEPLKAKGRQFQLWWAPSDVTVEGTFMDIVAGKNRPNRYANDKTIKIDLESDETDAPQA